MLRRVSLGTVCARLSTDAKPGAALSTWLGLANPNQLTTATSATTMEDQLTTATSATTMEEIAEQLRLLSAKVTPPAAKVYACLVDAENTQPSKLAGVVDELNGLGDVTVRRIYGDFSMTQLQPWRKVANTLSFRPFAQFAIISGKGSSDMALAMDAMDLLHDDSLHIDGFAIVSSDSDFTPLAARLAVAVAVAVAEAVAVAVAVAVARTRSRARAPTLALGPSP